MYFFGFVQAQCSELVVFLHKPREPLLDNLQVLGNSLKARGVVVKEFLFVTCDGFVVAHSNILLWYKRAEQSKDNSPSKVKRRMNKVILCARFWTSFYYL